MSQWEKRINLKGEEFVEEQKKITDNYQERIKSDSLSAIAILNKSHPSQNRYSEDIYNQILFRVCNGETVTRVCKSGDEFPHHSAVRWKAINDDEFAQRYARAREYGWESNLDYMLDRALSCGPDMADIQKARLEIDTIKWLAMKLYPKKYGDLVRTEVSGPDGGPIALTAVDSSGQVGRNEWIARRQAEIAARASAISVEYKKNNDEGGGAEE